MVPRFLGVEEDAEELVEPGLSLVQERVVDPGGGNERDKKGSAGREG